MQALNYFDFNIYNNNLDVETFFKQSFLLCCCLWTLAIILVSYTFNFSEGERRGKRTTLALLSFSQRSCESAKVESIAKPFISSASTPSQNERKGDSSENQTRCKSSNTVKMRLSLSTSEHPMPNLHMHPDNTPNISYPLKTDSAILEQVSSRESESKRFWFYDACAFFPQPFWNSPDHPAHQPPTSVLFYSIRFSALSPMTFKGSTCSNRPMHKLIALKVGKLW